MFVALFAELQPVVVVERRVCDQGTLVECVERVDQLTEADLDELFHRVAAAVGVIVPGCAACT